jgi:2-hydroxymuconate-semialdehyde hydrolase
MMSQAQASPEVGKTIEVNGIKTNYHDSGEGPPVLLLHGSGPGVSAWANWRLTLPDLAKKFRALAPDVVGFGYTDRPADFKYGLDAWVEHLIGFIEQLGLERVSLLGNSMGGALSLALTIKRPDLVDKVALMGSAGVPFPITKELDAVWGYTPSFEAMRAIMDIFAFDRNLVTDELAELRYRASVRPGWQESYSAMWPAPRQRWVDALASPEDEIRKLDKEVLLIHGRDDRIVPFAATSLRLLNLIPRAQLHVFGQCGHWTQIEHTARFNRLVSEFFSS